MSDREAMRDAVRPATTSDRDAMSFTQSGLTSNLPQETKAVPRVHSVQCQMVASSELSSHTSDTRSHLGDEDEHPEGLSLESPSRPGDLGQFLSVTKKV